MSENSGGKFFDLEEMRSSIVEILAFENKAKTYLREVDNDDKKSPEEKAKLKAEFKEKEKAIDQKRSVFLKSVEDRSIGAMEDIVKILQSIYVENRDLKPLVKKLLTESAFRKQISILRKEDFAKAYPIIEFISNKFPVDDYPMYTLKPEAVLYGSEVEKTAKGSLSLAPLSNDEIMKCLEVFKEKNQWALYNWVMAIFALDMDQIVVNYKDKFIKERQDLLLLVIEKTKTDLDIQKAISEKLFEKGDLARIVNLQVAGNRAEKQVKELEEKVAEMTESAKEKENSYWDRVGKQKAIIDEKEAIIEKLTNRVKNYDEMSSRLTEIIRRHEAQVKINDLLVIDYDKKLEEISSRERMVTEANEQLKIEIADLQNLYENVKSDLSLKTAEISRISESLNETEAKAKESILCELVSMIKDQLYYISLFYEELVETGSLEKESIEMFGDTIQNINESFKELGVSMYGVIDETVEYDSSLHDSMGVKLSNGEKAIIRVPGWKINDVVYAKAQVEKEN